MLLIAAAICLLLAVINYRTGGKAIFHPAVIFALTWGGGIFLIWAAGDFFYWISARTLMIFVAGVFAFTIGSAITTLYPEKTKPRPPAKPFDWLINASIVLIILGAPLGVRWVLQQVAQHPSSNFFGSVSNTMLDENLMASFGYSLFSNLVTFSNMIAIIAFYEREGHKKRWWLALTLALGLDVITAGRSGFISLIFSIVCLDWIQTRRLRWKLLIALGLVMFTLASAIAILLGKAGAKPDASLAENAAPVMRGLVLYATGGAVAFDKIVENPSVQPHDMVVTIFFVQTLNKFGANLPLPQADVGYMDLGPNLLLFNAYSIYYTYLSLGYLGMMAMMVFLGIVVTACYKSALRGNRVAAIMYSSLFSGLILSLVAEYFFDALNYLIKLFVISWMVYCLPAAWSRFRALLGRSVENELFHYKQF